MRGIFSLVFVTLGALYTRGFHLNSGIPNQLHGMWFVDKDDGKDATFELNERHMIVSYNSAKISMSHNVSNGSTLSFHNLTIHQKPMLWDIKKIFKGLSYITQVQKYGLNIYYTIAEDDPNTIHVSWNVSSSLNGYIRLVRNNQTETGGIHCFNIRDEPRIE